ncbi:c-type cytochrome biogenesis protein CcmI [Pistricoccus aurantiacus]|uniref:c-type cytochrome biogenesis protein CcmI n=1 Tax=Pistricoccus aurantiacus TaxID=1883414 RepID=UPI00364311BD
MTLLWLGLAILLLIAMWLLILPLRRAGKLHDDLQAYEAEDQTAQQNVAIFQRRLASLEAALGRGDIDQQRFEESRLELERSLLEDTQAQKRAPLKRAVSGRWLVPVIMLALAAGSLLWYQQQGAEGDLSLYLAQQEVMADPDSSLATLIERLEQEAVKQPDNPKVWSSLFPMYRNQGQFDKAIHALKRVIELEGRYPELLAQLAQMQFFAANRTLTSETQTLVDEVLAEDPRQPTVLGMLGIEAFDHGRYQEAIKHWRRAMAGMSDPQAQKALEEGIQVARQRLDQGGEGMAAAQEAGPELSVRLSLDDSLRDRVPPDTRVFLVARDLKEEKPPLAIAMTQVSELPTTLVLDDSRSMNGMGKLSSEKEVRLVVRVSQSGQAQPQPGDLAGQLESVSVATSDPVEVVIDRVVD